MIPYVIEHSNPSDDINERNIDTSYYSSEKDKLTTMIFAINIGKKWKLKWIIIMYFTLNILKMIGNTGL